MRVVALAHAREVKFLLAAPGGRAAHAPEKRGRASISSPGLPCPAAA